MPAGFVISDEMLTLSAFWLDNTGSESASLTPGQTAALSPITEFGANAYTEEEERSLSEIIQAFNERHGTNFTREDLLRFEQVNQEILDDDMMEMMRNNSTDVIYNAFTQAFFHGMVRVFHKDNFMQSLITTDRDAREQATRHFFKRAQQRARGWGPPKEASSYGLKTGHHFISTSVASQHYDLTRLTNPPFVLGRDMLIVVPK